MKLDVYNTSMQIYPYNKGDYEVIENMYTSIDKFSGKNNICGYIIEENKLYLPRGTPVSKIESILNIKSNYMQASDEYDEMSKQFLSIREARDNLQEESIEFLTTERNHQLALNLGTGIGKAQPVSTIIPSPTRNILMKDIVIGDIIFGSNGTPITVIGVFDQGIRKIYKITFHDGRISFCCKEHLWKIISKDSKEYAIDSLENIMLDYQYKEYKIPVSPIGTYKESPVITNIKFSHMEEARCIKVDAADQLYLTEDYIVTHNTFCVAYASTQLNEKTIIITPNEGLKQQWINTYIKMFNYKPKHLLNIVGSDIIVGIMEDDIPLVDIYFVNHATLRNYLTSTNGYSLHKFFKKIKVGIKVYDEAHLEFSNIISIDSFSNTNRTWYLTATFDRSDKTESVCFQRAFSSVLAFGELESTRVMEKHVIYHIVNINSRPTPKNRAKVLGFPGFTSAKYGRYSFLEDDNHTAYHTILKIIEKITELDGKILIFVPLIEAVDMIVDTLKKDCSHKSISSYHSKKSKMEKEDAINKDIIVTTIKSCGTGKDIPGLRSIICLEPIASKVIAQQLIGRLRPYAKNKMTYFFDVLDVTFPAINYYHRSRFSKITTLVKEVVYLDLDD